MFELSPYLIFVQFCIHTLCSSGVDLVVMLFPLNAFLIVA